MTPKKPLKSTVGKKVIMAVSGIFLMLFLIVHLGGNLTMFVSADLFNSYAHHLESLGPLLYVAEAGLLAIFLFHVVSAFQVHAEKKRARPEGYAVSASKGGNSKMTVASKSMIYTGVILLLFIPAHIWMFKFNGGQAFTYTEIHEQPVKDLFAVVANAFANPLVAFGYAGVMLLLGLHLRHGFWSSLQSLGAMCPKMSPLIYTAGLIFALALAGGFFVLPLYFYFCGGSCAVNGGAL
jgi:succinate dehydrogenase / fumarate reductase cytochrome b subunit